MWRKAQKTKWKDYSDKKRNKSPKRKKIQLKIIQLFSLVQIEGGCEKNKRKVKFFKSVTKNYIFNTFKLNFATHKRSTRHAKNTFLPLTKKEVLYPINFIKLCIK